jgi:hypothetical protein
MIDDKDHLPVTEPYGLVGYDASFTSWTVPDAFRGTISIINKWFVKVRDTSFMDSDILFY